MGRFPVESLGAIHIIKEGFISFVVGEFRAGGIVISGLPDSDDAVNEMLVENKVALVPLYELLFPQAIVECGIGWAGGEPMAVPVSCCQ